MASAHAIRVTTALVHEHGFEAVAFCELSDISDEFLGRSVRHGGQHETEAGVRVAACRDL